MTSNVLTPNLRAFGLLPAEYEQIVASLGREPNLVELGMLGAMWSELIFRGCGGLDSRAHADAFDRLGLSRSSDVSTFHLRFGATFLGARVFDVLPVIAQTIRSPRFDAEAIEPTRDLSMQALASLADDPQERSVLAARERHNPPPLNRSGLGTPEGLASISRDDLVAGWARQCAPPAGTSGGRRRPAISRLPVRSVLPTSTACPGADRLLAGGLGRRPPVTNRSTTRGKYHHVQDESSQVQIVLMHDGLAEKARMRTPSGW
jgi:hypothetical protein